MAEKAIRVAAGASGLYVATRDSFEPDDGAHARVVERVDFASGKFSSPIGSALRSAVAAVDAIDLTALPAGLTGALITVGDKSLLCVAVEQSVSGGNVVITPILYDNEASPGIVGILGPKTATQPTYNFRRGTGSGLYPMPILTWDILGAYKIGLHVTYLSAANAATLYGWVV